MLIIEIVSDLAVITAALWLLRVLYANIRLTRRVLEKLDALPAPILKDLQKRSKKAKLHPVKYIGEDGIVKTAGEMQKGTDES